MGSWQRSVCDALGSGEGRPGSLGVGRRGGGLRLTGGARRLERRVGSPEVSSMDQSNKKYVHIAGATCSNCNCSLGRDGDGGQGDGEGE